MLSLSPDNQSEIIQEFNGTRYLDGILNTGSSIFSFYFPRRFLGHLFFFQCVRPLFVWIWVSWPIPLGVSCCKILWGLLF